MRTRESAQHVRAIALAALVALAGCEKQAGAPAAQPAHEEPAGPSNRVDIRPAVRHNLGMSFATVERRSVAHTLRIPGRFELLPSARREYRAVVGGTVELLVKQYQTVQAGDALYRLDSQRWREMQRELVDAHAAVKFAKASVDSIAPLLEAHENHHAELQKSVDLWTSRVASLEQLQAAGGARGDDVAQAKASLATARSDLAETFEKEAELNARKTDSVAHLEAATARLAFLFESAASISGIPARELQAPASTGQTLQRWQTMNHLEVRAMSPGVVESVAAVSGGFIESQAPVLSTVQPESVRFRAVGLQSDLPRLADGQHGVIVSAHASGTASDDSPAIQGIVTIAPTADPERRTIDLILVPSPSATPAHWAKAGVSAFLEVVTSGSPKEELAIPLRCVARDGSSAIIFRRDPANPDKAIRLEADLGLDDGRWVVIKSGVAEGNEIVLDGVYQLMVATSGSITKGGHFHPDGTFHEGDE
jgi:multidrug resistance efflux pump